MAFWRVRATVDDRPGYLSVLTASLALRSVNILSVQVHATEAGAVDDFLVDAPDALTEAELLAAVAKGRGRDAWVGRADVRGLVDTQTQLLGVAARLVRDPEGLGSALVALLGGGCEVSWSPQPCPAGRDFGLGLMRLPDPAGGSLLVRRAEPPFTPAEFARAHALVDLSAAVLDQAERRQLLLPGGDELTVRTAGPQDAEAVLALRAGCSPGNRHRRYLSASGRSGELRMSRQLGAPGRITLLAEIEAQARVVAMATVVRDGPEAEVGLLVADGYRRRGVGGALLRRAARLAAEAGIVALHAHTQPDNVAMMSTMHRLGLPLRMEIDGPLLSLTADLRPEAIDGVDAPPAQGGAAGPAPGAGSGPDGVPLRPRAGTPEVPGGTGTPCPAP
jgi:GNAT superfamily N-acetyltransferase